MNLINSYTDYSTVSNSTDNIPFIRDVEWITEKCKSRMSVRWLITQIEKR